MADPKLVELLKKGSPEWNLWRSKNRLLPLDLTLANLGGADLTGASLGRADLCRAELSCARLIEANLRGANLREATLRQADLSGAYLKKADLSGANLSEADLRGVNLLGANLSEANLSGTDLVEANFSQADLIRANLEGAALRETVFANSNLTSAEGLDQCNHVGPSILDYRTLAQSAPLPLAFLRGCGLPDTLIEYLPSILNQAIQFYSCFISYSHEDKAFARRLHDALQGRGIRCWLDEKQLLPGDDIS